MKRGWRKWNPIEKYETKYHITRKGEIKSLKSNCILKASNNRKGYFQIYLYSGSRKTRKRFYIHFLVGKTFIPNPENKPQINHLDGDGKNNSVKNLEWCTRQENQLHAYKMGLQKSLNRDTGHGAAKITTKDIAKIRNLYKGKGKGPTQAELGKQFGLHFGTISAILNYKSHYKK